MILIAITAVTVIATIIATIIVTLLFDCRLLHDQTICLIVSLATTFPKRFRHVNVICVFSRPNLIDKHIDFILLYFFASIVMKKKQKIASNHMTVLDKSRNETATMLLVLPRFFVSLVEVIFCLLINSCVIYDISSSPQLFCHIITTHSFLHLLIHHYRFDQGHYSNFSVIFWTYSHIHT